MIFDYKFSAFLRWWCFLKQSIIPAVAHAEAAHIWLRVALVRGDKRLMRDLKAGGVVKPPHGGALLPNISVSLNCS